MTTESCYDAGEIQLELKFLNQWNLMISITMNMLSVNSAFAKLYINGDI